MDKEQVNSPEHYNAYDKEVINMMEAIWGKEEVAIFSKLNAFKYRMRLGLKGDIEQFKVDLKKEKWYLDKKKELTEKKTFIWKGNRCSAW